MLQYLIRDYVHVSTYSFLVNILKEITVHQTISAVGINNRTMCDVRRSGVFIVNFEQILHILLVYSLLTISK